MTLQKQGKIRMFMSGFGVIMGRETLEESACSCEGQCDGMHVAVLNAGPKLMHPISVSKAPADKSGVYVNRLWLDEEWCIVPYSAAIELSVSDAMEALYKEQEQALYGTIKIVKG